MDNPSKSAVLWEKLVSLSKMQKFLIFGIIFVSFILLAILVIGKSKTTSQEDNVGEIVATVGSENIFADDIASIASIQTNRSEKDIIEQVKRESKILQNAAKESLVEVPEDYFSDETPIDNAQRQNYIETAEKTYEQKSMQIEGALITVFFYNQQPPAQMTFDQADKRAFELISVARERVVKGQMQPAIAIAALANNSDVAKLDWNAKLNTGFTFDKQAVWRLTSDKLYRETLQKIPPGGNRQVSEIVRYPGPKDKYPESYFNSDQQNGYYFFFVLDNKTDG